MRFRNVALELLVANRGFTNVYAILHEDETTLVDTGEPSFAGPLIQAIASLPPVRNILLTHVHYDHAGSAAALAATTGARVHAHAANVELLRSGAWRRASKPSPTMIGRVLTRLVADRFPDRVAPVTEIEPISGDQIDIAGGLDVIPLPGHAAGQVGFGFGLSNGRTAWIVGDVVMTILGLQEPILYEDRGTGLSSIARLADGVSNGDLICPGHGRVLRVTSDVRHALAGLSRG